ncbi:hypothetical protein SK128_021268 [Halocaridina rubra]|uniref:HEAT repeat-containing protein 6 n=1 Tax=Halocaridina rubra TaxID=373956 RepID=A0AAN9A0L3_HALRR
MSDLGRNKASLSWNDSITAFLQLKTPLSEEKELELCQILSDLCRYHATSALRMSYDIRQIQNLVEHCFSFQISSNESYIKPICQFLTSLLRRQVGNGISSECSDQVIMWLNKALLSVSKEAQTTGTVRELLRALACILRDAPEHTDEIYFNLAGPRGSLIQIMEHDTSWHIQAPAMQCLHLLTYVSPEIIAEARQLGDEIFPPEVVSNIQRVAIRVLKQNIANPSAHQHKLYSCLVASALNVIYNLVVCAPNDILGSIIVSACHPFIFFGLPGFIHTDLMQNSVGLEVDIPVSSRIDSDTSSRTYTNRNRRKRLRRKRAQLSRSTLDPGAGLGSVIPSVEGVRLGFKKPPPASALAGVSLKPQWARVERVSNDNEKSMNSLSIPGQQDVGENGPETCDNSSIEVLTSGSETDFSDIEGGGAEKEVTLMARVRQCSLQAINAVIMKVGKQHKFSYWPTLMCQTPSLMTSVLKDPSPSVRMAALQVMNTFLLNSSQVFAMALDVPGKGPYTSFGHQLGTSIRELHRCLALALLSEKFTGALVKTLKTIELLTENVNYSKLKPGLLTKIVTHVKYFLRFKEAVVQANAFSVMVSILMIKPQVPELRDLLLRYQTPAPASLSSAVEVVPPSLLEEELPGEDSDEEEVELQKAMVSKDEGETEENKLPEKNTVSWLIQRCIDSLLSPDREALRGIYIQVQLQSLKVLTALVSEHLSIIHQSLPLLQHVIIVCSDAINGSLHCSQSVPTSEPLDSNDPSLVSTDPGVVVEHAFILLGSLLGAVKSEFEKDGTACISFEQAQQLWLWTLQGPLQCLLEKASIDQKSRGKNEDSDCTEGGLARHNWRSKENDLPSQNPDYVKQLIAMATVLSHFSSEIFESLGEEWAAKVIMTVKWLVTNRNSEFQLAGVRVMATIVGFRGVMSNPGGASLLQVTLKTTLDIFSEKESFVNRDRLLASWALANMSSVLESYRENWQLCESGSNNPLYSVELLGRLLEVGILTCNDKNKIRMHGVRCIGSVTSFLDTDVASNPKISPLVSRSIEMLVLCSSTGNNMKTRWNACYALGCILGNDRIPVASAPWRIQVITTLGKLVESFKNYKVRIQACSALCGLRSREAYGAEYIGVWRVLLNGLDNAQNIIDYQEIRHRDELINQICQGICQIIAHMTLEDAGSLCDLLQLHQDMVDPLMKKAQLSLPPERTAHILFAQSRVEELLSSDALTEPQGQVLIILQYLICSV